MGAGMNVLLVDDEKYVLDAIKQKVNWDTCDIQNILTANNIRKAKRIIETTDIQIILCDIVMPQGTGFDLLGWVREQNYQPEVIFLTSYADFTYARKAIELECLDYLLKPIDYEKLESTIRKAVEKIQRINTIEKRKKRSDKHIRKEYLRSILHAKTSIEIRTIISSMKSLDIGYPETTNFLPVLVHMYAEKEAAIKVGQNNLEFILNNALEELAQNSIYSIEAVLSVEKMKFIVLLKERDTDESKSSTHAEDIFTSFLNWCTSKLMVDTWCGIGYSCNILELTQEIEQLKEMRGKNLAIWNTAVYRNNMGRLQFQYHNPNIKLWSAMLKEKREKDIIDNIIMYLNRLQEKKIVNKEILNGFRTDIIQLLYSFLAAHEIKAHLLFSDPQSEELYNLCLESVKGARKFTEFYINRTLQHMEFASETNSVTEIICKYLDNNYQKDINRDDLVKIVYLNPDYISRIFKQEAGVSIKGYLTKKRMDAAKNLLKQSEMPVQAAAMHTGYSNFAYFTKLFRENTGYSPIEYRKKEKEWR